MHPLYPLRFRPILRQLIWGGRRLGSVLHKPIGEASDYAESWELSDYHDAVSVVDEGPLAGATLREMVKSRGAELLGSAIGPREQFPLLVKFIDANEVLSVQVHPDQETGRRLAGDNGKTETWVILAAEPGSLIYAGLKSGVGPLEFATAIENGSVERLLHSFEPKAGDSILIEAGTVHAIGAGVLLAEIQQMSDATFRVYDWGRLQPDGTPRSAPLDLRRWNRSSSTADPSIRWSLKSSGSPVALASDWRDPITSRSSGFPSIGLRGLASPTVSRS